MSKLNTTCQRVRWVCALILFVHCILLILFSSAALQDTWGIPLLGCIPDRPFLGCPALADLERVFNTELVCGQMHRYRHYSVNDMNLITTSLTRFLENIRSKHPRTLYICHVTRDDIILGFMVSTSALTCQLTQYIHLISVHFAAGWIPKDQKRRRKTLRGSTACLWTER